MNCEKCDYEKDGYCRRFEELIVETKEGHCDEFKPKQNENNSRLN